MKRQGFEDAFDIGLGRLDYRQMDGRDRGFARAIALATLRAHGRLSHVVGRFLERPLPDNAGRTHAILSTGAAQLLMLDAPPHAVISQAVDIARLDRVTARFDRLINAVLRRVAEQGRPIFAELDPARHDIPAWLQARWVRAYGAETADQMSRACCVEPPLDLTCREAPDAWAARLDATLLPTGTLRRADVGRIEELEGYSDGAWWVQDAAAALPVRLLGPVGGRTVLDLCAAPGGKTMQLVSQGARVTAVDASAKRCERLQANLARIDREVRIVTADAIAFCAEHQDVFDAVLLDAPCSATGTIRRHPDMLFTKPETEIARLADRQAALIRAAATTVAPGGVLVYATCSLEPEEGPGTVERFLADQPRFSLEGAAPFVPAHLVTAQGTLRTLPQHALGDTPLGRGMDGFFAARLRRKS
jgi:16S rRNA (cytosine967-C5)-methyltransferase